jgi:transposase
LDKYLPSQKRDGLKVSETIILASIYRALISKSKRSFSSWSKETTLPEIANFSPNKLTSQHFWDQMDTVTDSMIEGIEKDLTVALINKYNITLDTLFYDTTNFFTFIDTANERSSLTKRGHNKQKRNDLRQFSLALLVEREFFIPLSSKVYQGNINDSFLFKEYLPEILNKFKEINLELKDLTIVFDKGNNSKDAFSKIDSGKIHYVASISPFPHKDLIEAPLSSYSKVTVNGKEILSLRTVKEIWGKKRTVILYKSEKLFIGQLRGLEKYIKTALNDLENLKEELKNENFTEKEWKKKKDKIKEKIVNILKGEWSRKKKELIKFNLRRSKDGFVSLSYNINDSYYKFLLNNYFGKRILITDQKGWKTEEIIAAYWGQSKIEEVFKHLKNPYHNSAKPTFHWTDSKIKVHTFTCLIGLLLVQLLHKKVREKGINLSIDEILLKLKGIRKGNIIYLKDSDKKIKVEKYIEEIDNDQKELLDIVNGF